MKKLFVAGIAMMASLLLGCSADNQNAVMTTADNVPDKSLETVLYLRGEMNDYTASHAYRLIPSVDGLCTMSMLRADWSPYKFKFADEHWTAGTNYGYAMAPGTIRQGQGAVKLNANSHFEEISVYIKDDGIYRFCLIERADGPYATVELTDHTKLASLPQSVAQ